MKVAVHELRIVAEQDHSIVKKLYCANSKPFLSLKEEKVCFISWIKCLDPVLVSC